uniref:Uncharacterized protein n=1 Tax=Opuntia streptacantha TaxID=393608 RepID=A0A7C8ZUZ3_OPUST
MVISKIKQVPQTRVQEGQKEEKKLHATGQAKQHDEHQGVVGAEPASQGRAGDGQPLPGRRPVASHNGQPSPLPLLCVFAASLLFLFNVLSWDFFGGLLREY